MSIEDYLENMARNRGMSPRDKTISDTFYGLSIVGRNPGIALNQENHGYTFFTRPMMNLSSENISVDRVVSNLLRDEPYSVQRMIRSYLDPSLPDGESSAGIDHRNAFIPLLSNNLISLSGWHDFTLNTTTSAPGLYREEYSYVDDVPYNYGAFDLTASFRNLSGDPISFMFLIWGWYMGLVYEGRMMPYPDAILKNYIDYNTRIYRLVMDKTRTYVTRIGATGASFPNTSPIGNIFNFEGDGSESPFTTVNDQISINFRCMGFRYYDHILIYEFNKTAQLFNTSLIPDQDGNRRGMRKLSHDEKEYFNSNAYPQINEVTLELEWWVYNNIYQNDASGIIRPYLDGGVA